jgi:hypothetical protein
MFIDFNFGVVMCTIKVACTGIQVMQASRLQRIGCASHEPDISLIAFTFIWDFSKLQVQRTADSDAFQTAYLF